MAGRQAPTQDQTQTQTQTQEQDETQNCQNCQNRQLMQQFQNGNCFSTCPTYSHHCTPTHVQAYTSESVCLCVCVWVCLGTFPFWHILQYHVEFHSIRAPLLSLCCLDPWSLVLVDVTICRPHSFSLATFLAHTAHTLTVCLRLPKTVWDEHQEQEQKREKKEQLRYPTKGNPKTSALWVLRILKFILH